jgi:hypothetical protein
MSLNGGYQMDKRKTRKFAVIQGGKTEEKSGGLGPRPKDPTRTYEQALASKSLMKKLMNLGSAENLARYYWAGREHG